MRRVVINLLLFLFVAHALVPALTTYACAGMSGRHFLKPCCLAEAGPREAATPSATFGRGRCCDAHEPIVIDAKQPTQDETQPVLRGPLAVAASFDPPAAWAPPLLLVLAGRARGSPFGLAGPPQSQRQVLRI